MSLLLPLILPFVIKVRFPSHVSISNILIRKYDHDTLKYFRTHEKQNKKLEKVALDKHFLECCKAQEVFPKFLQFKLYRDSLHSTELYKSMQKTLLNNELACKERQY